MLSPRRALILVPAAVAVAAAGCVGWMALRRPKVAATKLPAPVAETVPRRTGDRLWIGLRSLDGAKSLTVLPTSSGKVVSGSTGRVLARLRPGVPVTVLPDPVRRVVQIRGAGMAAEDPNPVLEGGVLRVSNRRLPGRLRLASVGTEVELVNELGVEEYLRGVLPGELPRHFAPAAQRAQAVAARSYALAQRGKHGAFDLCDEQCCQMYLGQIPGATRGLAAVRATRGLVLWDAEAVACAFFSADCGGMMARAADVPLRDMPPGDLGFLQVKPDGPRSRPYCVESPYHGWTRRLKQDQLEAKLNRREPTAVGRPTEVTVLERDGSGRVTLMRLRGIVEDATPQADPSGSTPILSLPIPPGPVEKVISGWEFRRSMGALTLKSTLFTVTPPALEAGAAATWRFDGKGFGHGLGMCQIGADAMAKRGFTWRQILAHYYPGARIAPISGSEREPERPVVADSRRIGASSTP